MFEGPWKIINKDSLGKRFPKRGEIIKHKSGAIILNCPKCNAMQFTHSPVSGTNEIPTLSKPIQCGAGNCDRCGVWFQITAGKTLVSKEPVKHERPIPSKLVDAGVKKAPKLPPELQ